MGATQLLHGFTISGFRNFKGEPQWVAPLSRINIFIGSNNSGKSNVLRFVKRVIEPLIGSAPNAKATTSAIDRPTTGENSTYYEVLLPFFDEARADVIAKFRGWQEYFETELRRISIFDDAYIRVPIVWPRTNGAAEFPSKEFPPPKGINEHHWKGLWHSLTGSSGGGFHNNWYPETRKTLIRMVQDSLQCVYIPAFRHLTTRLSEFEDELPKADGETHLIDQIDELANPGWNEQHKKAQFEKLQRFMQTLLENPNVKIEVPSNGSTINVTTAGAPLPIEALGSGIHEVFMLAAQIVLADQKTVLLEEPEVHLHPTLQRQLMRFIVEETEAQFFIATHSAAIIDTEGAHVFGVSAIDGAARIVPLVTKDEKYCACRELGYRASDLLQSNCVLWVEGPSDRIYLKSWISDRASELVEGVHFSIMFYGGKLLSHLTIDDAAVEDYISLVSINRKSAILIDSDKAGGSAKIRDTKQRVLDEFARFGGLAWLTQGREIENYYSWDDRDTVVRALYPTLKERLGNRTRYSKPINYVNKAGEEKTADKIKVARKLTTTAQPDSSSSDFNEMIEKLVEFIRQANR